MSVSGVFPGTFSDHFWLHFGVILGSFLAFFGGPFSNAFLEGHQNEIFQFSFGFGVPGGGVF